MGQVLATAEAYFNVMWASLTGPPRPALAGRVNPKIKALMDGFHGGKHCAAEHLESVHQEICMLSQHQ